MAAVAAAAIVYIASLAGVTLSTFAVATAINIAIAVAAIGTSVKSARDQRKAAKRAQLESAQRNAFRNFRQPLTPRRTIYGRTRVAGPFIFAHNRADDEAHLIVALAGHEIDAIEEYHLLKEDLIPNIGGSFPGRVSGKYTNTVMMFGYLGTDDQNIGTKMISATDVRPVGAGAAIGLGEIITTADKFAGIAALYIITKSFGVSWDGQQPDFAATVRGKKVYDPRTDTTAWSANPALCSADYLVSRMGFPWESIDLDALIASADACDENVALKGGGTENRYECNGVLGAEVSHQENLETLADSMAGNIRYSSGLWIIDAGAPKSPAMAISESMVLGDYALSLEKPDRSLPNAVRGNFVDPLEWQATSYPQIELTAAIAAEGNTNWLEIDLPLTTSHSMAQRIAKAELAKARSRQSLSIDLDMRGLLVRPGDIVSYTSEDLGLDAAPFEVDSFAFSRSDGLAGPVLSTRLDLTGYDPDTYAWTAATDEIDLVTGTVDLDAVRSKFLQNLFYIAYTATTSPSFSQEYGFGGQLPATNTKLVQFYELSVTVRVVVTDGVDEDIVQWTATGTATSPTRITATQAYPAGFTYVSHTVPSAQIRVRFTDNSTTQWQEAPLDT